MTLKTTKELDRYEPIVKYIRDLRAKMDEAYERAARVVEERGAKIGGAIRPERTARAIRALKEQEKP